MIAFSIRSLAALALVWWWISPTSAQDRITFGTDWRAQAEHGGFYQALATGIYARYGLDVELRQGGPMVNHSQLLAAGRLDFSMAPNSFIPLNFAAQKIPMVAVAALFQKDPAVLIAHRGVGHDSLAALARAKIMISPDTRIGFWRFLKSNFGFTDDQIAPYTFNLAPFLADSNAVQQGYLTSEPFQIERAGISPNVFLLADSGYSSYAAIIMTSRDRVVRSPDQVRRFVAASIAGWISYLKDDPSPADALIKADNPDMTDDLLAYAREKMRANGVVDSGDAARLGVGAMTDARWRDFFHVMAQDGLYPRDLDYTRAYDLGFAGSSLSQGPERNVE